MGEPSGWNSEEHGPLPLFSTAAHVHHRVVPRSELLSLGRVFVANMTGNVVFLGFALAGAPGFSIVTSIVAIGSSWSAALVAGGSHLVGSPSRPLRGGRHLLARSA